MPCSARLVMEKVNESESKEGRMEGRNMRGEVLCEGEGERKSRQMRK